MTGTWNGKVVVVTGASAGIGRATARAFASEGASVGLVARGKAGLAAASDDVQRLGGSSLAIEVDVADAEAVEQAADEIEAKLGPIDVWVNDAMVSVFSPALEMTASEYARVTQVTYLGAVHGTLSALRRMTPRNRGVIVQVGSALAYRSIPLQSAYCASKAAIRGFTDSLRCELLHDHSDIKVSMVQMPALNTPQFDWVKSRLEHQAQPVPPIFEPEVAARAILRAAAHPRRELWVGASVVKAILATRFAPGALVDRYLARAGYSGQQTSQRRDPNAPHNLWKPVDHEPGSDHGARGRFTTKAETRSLELHFTEHRWLGIAGVVVAGATVTLIGRRASRP